MSNNKTSSTLSIDKMNAKDIYCDIISLYQHLQFILKKGFLSITFSEKTSIHIRAKSLQVPT